MSSLSVTIQVALGSAALALVGCSSGGATTSSTGAGSGGESAGSGGNTTSATTGTETGTGSGGSASTGTGSGPPDGGAGAALAFALDVGVDNASMDGLAVRTGWGTLEPTEGSYSWSTLDSTLDTVMAAQKQVTLHVVGSIFPKATPSWLYAAGAASFSDGKSTLPVPWDPVYLQKWKNFLPQLASHLTSKGYMSIIRNVSIAVPVPEMNLISCSPQKKTLDAAGTIPYDRDKYKAAWEQMIDLYAANFPAQNRLLSAPQDGICGHDNDTPFYHELMQYALAKDAVHSWMFTADLNALGSQRIQPYLDITAPLAFQPVAAYSNDPKSWVKGTMLQLYCAGLAAGGTYFEVYQEDLKNPDPAVQKGISAIHDPSLCAP